LINFLATIDFFDTPQEEGLKAEDGRIFLTDSFPTGFSLQLFSFQPSPS